MPIHPEDVALHVCCSGHMSTIAENLREMWQLEDREASGTISREILVLDDTMSSNVYPWQSLVEAGLATFCVVQQPPNLLSGLSTEMAPSNVRNF